MHLSNKQELIVAYACMSAGTIATPIDTHLNASDFESLMGQLMSPLYIGQAELFEAVKHMDVGILGANRRFLVDNTAEARRATLQTSPLIRIRIK